MTPFVIFAQEAGPPELPFYLNPIFMIMMMGLFFLVVVLPQSRRTRKEHEQMIASVTSGTKVVTSSGIVGVVVTAKAGEEEITIRSGDAKFRILRSSISRTLGEETADTK